MLIPHLWAQAWPCCKFNSKKGHALHNLWYSVQIFYEHKWINTLIAYSYEFKYTYRQFVCKEKYLSFLLVETLQCFGFCRLYMGALPCSWVSIDYVDWFSIASGPFGCQVSFSISILWDCQIEWSLATHGYHVTSILNSNCVNSLE